MAGASVLSSLRRTSLTAARSRFPGSSRRSASTDFSAWFSFSSSAFRLRSIFTSLSGFGIKTSEDAETIGKDADGVVVGTGLVNAIGGSLLDGKATASTV